MSYAEARGVKGLEKDLQDALRLIEELACAGWRLMKLAQGADVSPGDMQMACKEGMFSEMIAGQAIRALLKDREILMVANRAVGEA